MSVTSLRCEIDLTAINSEHKHETEANQETDVLDEEGSFLANTQISFTLNGIVHFWHL